MHKDKSIIRKVHMKEGDSIELSSNSDSPHMLTCEDIAKLALSMSHHSYFFLRRRGIDIHFSRDFNGGGHQGIFISRNNDEINEKYLLRVFFNYTYDNDREFLYEADLIMDQGKDYEPTVNKGIHRFIFDEAIIEIDIKGEEFQQWRSDIKLLSMPLETINDWIEYGFEMSVHCLHRRCLSFTYNPTIFSIKELEFYKAKGWSLDYLHSRLKCKKCGKFEARILPC